MGLITNRPDFPEIWAYGWLFACTILLMTSGYLIPIGQNVSYILIIIGCYLIYEIVVYQVTVILFDEYRSKKYRLIDVARPPYAIHGYRRLVLLTIQNYAEIMIWSAIFYRALSINFRSDVLDIATWYGGLYASVVTMTTMGFGDVNAKTPLGAFVLAGHFALSMFLTIVVIARVLPLIPVPKSMDDFD